MSYPLSQESGTLHQGLSCHCVTHRVWHVSRQEYATVEGSAWLPVSGGIVSAVLLAGLAFSVLHFHPLGSLLPC